MSELRNTERVLRNTAADRLLEIEREKRKSLAIDDIHDQVAGAYPKIRGKGEMDAGAWSCSMVIGLIHDVLSMSGVLAATLQRPHDRARRAAARLVAQPGHALLKSPAATCLRSAGPAPTWPPLPCADHLPHRSARSWLLEPVPAPSPAAFQRRQFGALIIAQRHAGKLLESYWRLRRCLPPSCTATRIYCANYDCELVTRDTSLTAPTNLRIAD